MAILHSDGERRLTRVVQAVTIDRPEEIERPSFHVVDKESEAIHRPAFHVETLPSEPVPRPAFHVVDGESEAVKKPVFHVEFADSEVIERPRFMFRDHEVPVHKPSYQVVEKVEVIEKPKFEVRERPAQLAAVDQRLMYFALLLQLISLILWGMK